MSEQVAFRFIPLKTRVVQPPHDEIWDILDGLTLEEGDIVFITSKILAIHQGRAVKASEADKVALIRQEAEHYLPFEYAPGHQANLTIINNELILAAGIDESNANGHYILWPQDADQLCGEIRQRLVIKHNLKQLGVVTTDSRSTPLRLGVTGFAIGLAGVEPLEDLRGQPDIFGKELGITQVNKIDALASMAVLLMGEGNETTPLVILRGYPGITFKASASMQQFKTRLETDLYRPLLEIIRENKGPIFSE